MIKKLSYIIIKKYKLILILSLIIFAAAAFTASKIGMDSKMDSMLPNDSNSLRASKQYDRYFDSQDTVLVVVQGEKSQCESYLAALAASLEQNKLVNNILYRVDMKALEDYMHLYIDTENYDMLEAELNNKNSTLSSFLSNKDFSSLSALFLQRLKEADTDKRETLLNEYVKLFQPNSSLSSKEEEELFSALLFGNIKAQEKQKEYIVSDSGSSYMMIIKPNIDMNDFVNSRKAFFDKLQLQLNKIKEEGKYELEAGITGGALVQDNEADNTMFNGFYSTALLTFTIIILFIVLSFKRFALPLASGYPLLLGAIVTTAFAYLAFKNLNMFSISFAVLLLGLGIDFAVHITSRYLEERALGADVSMAVANTIKENSMGMIVGAVTTAAAFLTFLIARFKAFTQMGVISGIGILVLCIIMLFVMPAAILLLEAKNKKLPKAASAEYRFLKPLGRLIEKRFLVFVITIIVLVLPLSANVLHTEIRTDMSKIYPKNMECLKWLEVVKSEFGYNPTTLQFMVDDFDTLKECVDVLSARNDVKRIESVMEYLPEDQAYKIAVINKLNAAVMSDSSSNNNTAADIVKAIIDIKDTADNLNINKSSEGYRTISDLVKALNSSDASSVMLAMSQSKLSQLSDLSKPWLKSEALTIDKLPESIKNNFVGREGRLSVELVPNTNIWDNENFDTLKTAIERLSGNMPVGMPAVMNEVTSYVKTDIMKISMFCLAVLFVILFIMFRSIKDTIIAALPLFVTVYAALGIMPVLGVQLNIFSIIAFPILIGIGIDSGVHLLHRLKASPDKDIAYILAHTGKAVMMTTITTLIGFGSLYFINHPGLASFGLVTVIGMSLCLILTLTLLPALYCLFYKKH